jgi:enamine deaminase RidA (YjgF/YER057c/UK114 family)
MKSLYYVVKIFYHIRVRGKGAVKGSGEKEGLGPLGQTLLLAPIRSHPTSRKRRKGKVVEQRVINPWTWQDEFGYVQAQEVSSAQRTLFCAGQTSVDADGRTVHPESMSAQITQAMDNLETVLRQAGAELSDVVRLTTTPPTSIASSRRTTRSSLVCPELVVAQPARCWAWHA